MAFIDLLLNVAAVLLWLSWRGVPAEPITRGALTLASNLRPAQRTRPQRWHHAIWLLGLLVFRALFYWHLGRQLGWVARWSPGAVTLAFRSDYFLRMLLFSLLGFGWSLFCVYGSMLLVAAVNRGPTQAEPFTRLIRDQLGILGRLPAWLQLVLPGLCLGVLWWPISIWFAWMGLLPRQPGQGMPLNPCMAVGLGGWLPWRWTLSVVLVVGVLLQHVYLGRHPFFEFIQITHQRLMRPVSWLPLRFGSVDLRSLVVLVGLWALVYWLRPGMPEGILAQLYQHGLTR